MYTRIKDVAMSLENILNNRYIINVKIPWETNSCRKFLILFCLITFEYLFKFLNFNF